MYYCSLVSSPSIVMLFLICLILIKVVSVSSFFNVSENDAFDICFKNVAKKYLHHYTNVLVGPRIKEINFSVESPIKIGNSTEFLTKNSRETAGSYTISYNHIAELNDTLTDIGVSNAIYYLVLANSKADLQKISENLWQLRLYKSVIFLPNKLIVKLYAIDLKNSKCGTFISTKKINECRNGKFKKDLNLFRPNMKKAFYKCPIRIIWSKYTPWIFDNNDTESGIYRDILSVFEERSHFNIIYMPESEVYTEELAFYNFGSIIADFDSDYADVFVGLVGFSASSDYVWTTGTIYVDNMYFVIPNPKMIPHWMLIYKLFLPTIWIYCFILFAVLSGFYTVLGLSSVTDRARFGNFLNNCFYLFSIIITVGCYRFPRNYKMRIFLGNTLHRILYLELTLDMVFFRHIFHNRNNIGSRDAGEILQYHQ